MAYVTQSDLERAAGGVSKLLQLSDLDSDGVVDTSDLDKTIDDAERWIDSYLQPRHASALPLEDPVPTIIRRVCAQEVVYQLKFARNAVDNKTQETRDANIEWLQGVAEGRIGVPGLDRKAKPRTAAKAQAGDRSGVTNAITRSSSEGLW